MLLVVRRFIAPIFFVLAAVAIATFGILSMYTTAYAVTINGETYDIFDAKEDVEAAIKSVEDKVEDVLEEPYEVNSDIQYEEVFVLKSHVTGNADDLEEFLYDSVDEITDSFILRVDGETVGIGDEKDLEQVVDEVSSQYVNENTVSVRVLSDVEINYETVPSELEEDTEAMTESLTEVVEGEVTYEVSETQTLKEVVEDVNTSIEDTDISTEQILTLNPELTDEITDAEEPDEDNADNSADDTADISNENAEDDIDVQGDADDEDSTDIDNSLTLTEIAEESAEDIVIEEGSTVTVEPEKTLLVVETQDIETHNKEIEFETIEEDDDELYIGESEVRVEGQTGIAEVSETVTKLNGKEVERVQTDCTVIEEPVDKVVAIGVKEPEPEIEPAPDSDILSDDAAINNSTTGLSDVDTNTGTEDANVDTEISSTTNYSNTYIWPLANYGTSSISSNYGWRVLNGVSEFHDGIDISAPYGTPIRASNGGIVITNTYNSARGWYVQIQHADGYITLYQHMNAQSPLAVGTEVYQGQTVGYVGNTGYSFGNHLHFEAWTSDYTPVNPMILFNSSSSSPAATGSTDSYAATADTSGSSLQNEIVEYAKQFLGCPYVYAGHGPNTFDCSGFTGYVYRHFGYEIYDSVECQLQYGTDVPIDVSQMQPGDLIFFATTGTGQATHVGMYIGDGQYIHASSTYGRVVTDTVRSTSNRPIVAVKRIV